MNGVCDWPGCSETETVLYSVVPSKRRELCTDHLEAFIRLRERRGMKKAFRKLDSRRTENGSDSGSLPAEGL